MMVYTVIWAYLDHIVVAHNQSVDNNCKRKKKTYPSWALLLWLLFPSLIIVFACGDDGVIVLLSLQLSFACGVVNIKVVCPLVLVDTNKKDYY